MIFTAVAIAAAVASLAVQGQTAPGNYSGLDRIGRRAALQQVAKLRHDHFRAGKVLEVAAERSHGLQRGPCGMPIIAADASIDPKILVPIPGSRATEPVSRPVEPPSCGPFALAPAHEPVPVQGSRREPR